ncbi:hypothetical protein SO802_023612 [Lithocarpus litseifolius]|uniref:Uncharacterized protein n=1 Tax=Lithocarpus litseifolius TaxID=425828 RepID=A0AAW2C6T6_9ROSI
MASLLEQPRCRNTCLGSTGPVPGQGCHELEEGSSWSLEGGSSAQSSDGAVETRRGGRLASEGEVDSYGVDSASDKSSSRGDDVLETSAHPEITEEQEAFILKVTKIPLKERRCRDLITPDALYAYYKGPKPTEEARRLHSLSRQLGQVEGTGQGYHCRKKGEGKGKEVASSSLPKVVTKGAPKRKGDGTDGGPSKKQTVTPGEHTTKPPSPKHGAEKGLMTAHGPVSQEAKRRLLTHKGYALEMLESIFKEKDVDPCVNQSVGELGDSGLFDLARAMVHMKALQVKGAKSEELLARQQKRIKNLTDGLEQYKDACRTLNGEVETTKADAVAEFKTSQTFVDSSAEYYGEGFEDCLKQIKSLHPYLDLSKVSMDDPLPSTPVGKTVLVDDDDLSESRMHPNDDGVVLSQPAQDRSVAPIILSADPPSFEGFPAGEVQNPLKDDEVVPDAPAV